MLDKTLRNAGTGLLASATSAVIAIGLLTGSVAPSIAAGGGDNATVPTCKKGKIWDKKSKKCVKIKESFLLDDDNLYEAARDLAYHKRYEEALDVLKLAKNQGDPRILNYRGYATRKLGRVEEGLTYYTAALKADPDYTLVREYMGEAFLQLNQVDKAREQLAEIEKRCGTGCREYALLADQIDGYLATK